MVTDISAVANLLALDYFAGQIILLQVTMSNNGIMYAPTVKQLGDLLRFEEIKKELGKRILLGQFDSSCTHNLWTQPSS